MLNNFVSYMAQHTKSQLGQKSFINIHRAFPRKISVNPFLNPESWGQLFKKSKVDIAVELVRGFLEEDQIISALKDKRKNVRSALLANKKIIWSDKLFQTLLTQPWFDEVYAADLISSGTLKDENLKKIALIENDRLLVSLMCVPELFTIEEVINLLPNLRYRNCKDALSQLVDLRPQIIPYIMDIKKGELRDALTASRHLKQSEIRYLLKSSYEDKTSYYSLKTISNLLLQPNVASGLVKEYSEVLRKALHKHDGHSQMVYKQIFHFQGELHRNNLKSLEDKPWEDFFGTPFGNEILQSAKILGAYRYPTIRDNINATYSYRAAEQTAKTTSSKIEEDIATLAEIAVQEKRLWEKVRIEHVSNISKILDEKGELSWDIFWSLANTFEGSLEELLKSVDALSK